MPKNEVMNTFAQNPKIVLTGGPGGGKTTAADLFRRELGGELVTVPETATILFSGGFPRTNDFEVIKATQRAIYHVQRSLEDVKSHLNPNKVLLCDRGTLDGLAYWPNSEEHFFSDINTSMDAELQRYSAVVFFESSAAGNIQYDSSNPVRNESLKAARELDIKLQKIWSRHPRYHFVPHTSSFLKKMNDGIKLLDRLVKECRNQCAQM
ncbi:MAG: AAA family ATPase [Bdellovibrionales bacterium]|nr:AAA family ATPase [Bdellovibrionales bacterium]